MIGGEKSMEVRVLAKHGKGIREIARDLGLSRKALDLPLSQPRQIARSGLLTKPDCGPHIDGSCRRDQIVTALLAGG